MNQVLVNNNRSRDWFYGGIQLIVNNNDSRNWLTGANHLIVNNNGFRDWEGLDPNYLYVLNYGSRDAVIALAPVSLLQTNAVAAAYVRARDQFSCEIRSNGTYYIYVTQGEDWDSAQGRFTRSDSYSRFADAANYSQEKWYTHVTVTLGGTTTSSPSVTVERSVAGRDDSPDQVTTTSSPSVSISPSQFPIVKYR